MECLNKNDVGIFMCVVCYKDFDIEKMYKFECECKYYYCYTCFNNLKKSDSIEKLFICSICKKESLGLKLNVIVNVLQKFYNSVLQKFNENKKTYGEKRKSKYFMKVKINNDDDYVLIHNMLLNYEINWLNALIELMKEDKQKVNNEIIKSINILIDIKNKKNDE